VCDKGVGEIAGQSESGGYSTGVPNQRHEQAGLLLALYHGSTDSLVVATTVDISKTAASRRNAKSEHRPRAVKNDGGWLRLATDNSGCGGVRFGKENYIYIYGPARLV